MEREPLQPLPKRTPAEAPRPHIEQERGGFFEKWRKKMRPAEKEPKQNPETQSGERKDPSEKAPQSERRKFGKEILSLIFGGTPEAQPVNTTQAEVPEAAPTVETAEQLPQFERATRMRRFARVVIARVLGEAANEPARAARRHETEPLDTAPLVEAAHELRDAADDLNEAVEEASLEMPSVSVASERGGDSSYDSYADRPGPRSERPAVVFEQTASERIDDRLRQLEENMEVSRRAAVAAAGLGVLAVILTGAEYFSRRHSERAIRQDAKDVKQEFKKQEHALQQQRVVFDRLRETQAQDMNRNQRREYYEHLSAFTHQQVERTREATVELQHAVEQAAPVVATVPGIERRQEEPNRDRDRERRMRRLRHPEFAPVAEQPEIAPLLRVENADTIERLPGQQTGNAGTGFFGGGGGGIASGTGPSDLTRPQQPLDPNSPEARKLEELRKLEQARLQQNAWFYGAALIVTMAAAVVAAIVIG